MATDLQFITISGDPSDEKQRTKRQYRKGEDARRRALEADSGVLKVGKTDIVCKGCSKLIQLNYEHSFYDGNWVQHSKTCWPLQLLKENLKKTQEGATSVPQLQDASVSEMAAKTKLAEEKGEAHASRGFHGRDGTIMDINSFSPNAFDNGGPEASTYEPMSLRLTASPVSSVTTPGSASEVEIRTSMQDHYGAHRDFATESLAVAGNPIDFMTIPGSASGVEERSSVPYQYGSHHDFATESLAGGDDRRRVTLPPISQMLSHAEQYAQKASKLAVMTANEWNSGTQYVAGTKNRVAPYSRLSQNLGLPETISTSRKSVVGAHVPMACLDGNKDRQRMVDLHRYWTSLHPSPLTGPATPGCLNEQWIQQYKNDDAGAAFPLESGTLGSQQMP
ncbi:hypothetical protein H0H92_013986 [Tricholoma furcatifolium]|nr:hypothetical protein H0H92_013986 [Tricholoma furcatifolium]